MTIKALYLYEMPSATCIECHLAGDNSPKGVTCFVQENTGDVVWRYCEKHLEEAKEKQIFKLYRFGDIPNS